VADQSAGRGPGTHCRVGAASQCWKLVKAAGSTQRGAGAAAGLSVM
jgi:hypothetical protein